MTDHDTGSRLSPRRAPARAGDAVDPGGFGVRRALILPLVLLAGHALAGPTLWDEHVAETLDLPRAGDVRVLVWNVQRGAAGFSEGPEKTVAWIRAVRPDVVLMQESYDIDGERPTLGRWAAEQLNWNAHQGTSPHLCVLSPMEMVATFHHADWHGVGATLRDGHGRVFTAYSVWIDYRHYSPYHLRDEPAVSDADLIADEAERSDRLRQANAIIQHLRDQQHLPSANVPLLVGGDWNCPSHLDWTADAALVLRFRRDLDLPVSMAMRDAGFHDAFRDVHPDPVQAPGITWSPLYRGTPETPETADRIDRLYIADPTGDVDRLIPIAATVLPLVLEDAGLEQAARVFPSDHAAVVIDLAWRPRPVFVD